jgi:serine protease Do
MSTVKMRAFTSAAAMGAAAVLAVGVGGCWAAARAGSPPGGAANAPGGANSRISPLGAPDSFADIVSKVAPAVVSIDIEKKASPNNIDFRPQEMPSPFQFFFGAPGAGGQGNPDFRRAVPQVPGGPNAGSQNAAPVRASGSGFFITADGYVVTNNHVIDGADKITVHTSDNREFKARVIGHDRATDLAVLKVEGGPFQFVSFENRAKPRVGDWVVAVGNPFGLGGTATAGIVSALGRQNVSGSSFVDYMQIDAPINRGNSGGPTFDVDGHVVGVNTAIYSPSGGSVGIGFDIPADVAAATTHQLMETGKVTRGYIGATVQTISPELADSLGLASAHGAVVDGVTPGGPSERGGLRAGDVIMNVGGHSVDSASDLTRQVALARPGDEIRVAILRAGEQREIAIRSGERPSEPSLASNEGTRPGDRGNESAPGVLGLDLTPDPNGGLVVDGVAPSSDAASAGLRQGDVILRAGSRSVQSATDLSQSVALARAAGRKSVPLLVARAGRRFYVAVAVASGRG